MIDRKESIDYINEGITISVCSQHFSEHAEIIIRRTEVNGEITNEIFRLDWFIYYFNGCSFSEYTNSIDDLLKSIALLKSNYHKFMDIQWCRDVMDIVRKSLKAMIPMKSIDDDFRNHEHCAAGQSVNNIKNKPGGNAETNGFGGVQITEESNRDAARQMGADDEAGKNKYLD